MSYMEQKKEVSKCVWGQVVWCRNFWQCK